MSISVNCSDLVWRYTSYWRQVTGDRLGCQRATSLLLSPRH